MKFRRAIFLIIPALILVSCGNRLDTQGINLKLEIQPETITDFLYIKMNYEYSFTDEYAGIQKDYRVFVHFHQMKNREMLIQDDHDPVVKTTDWVSDTPLSYSRTVFVPKFLDEFDIDFKGQEEVRLTIGLYNPQMEDDKIVLFKEVLNVQSAALNAPEIIYDEGWHQMETDLTKAKPGQRHWRWTSDRAVCIVENPKKEYVLIIRGGVPKDKLTDQKVIFKINDQTLDEFVPETSEFDKTYTITPEMMASADEFSIVFETDQSFIPSNLNPESKDNRELGMQIFFLYFRENIK